MNMHIHKMSCIVFYNYIKGKKKLLHPKSNRGYFGGKHYHRAMELAKIIFINLIQYFIRNYV